MSTYVSQIVTDILSEVDPNRRRWDDSVVLGHLNEAVRALASAKCFARRDILVGVAGQSFYTPLAAVAQISKVWYDGTRLQGLTLGEIDQRLLSEDTAWQGNRGTPAYYCATPTGVRIAKAPSASGTALTFVGTPAVSANDGVSVPGDRMWSALNGTTKVHFQPGDGLCTNAETATNNIWVEYFYHPRRVDLMMQVHERLELALLNYGLYKTLRTSRDSIDVARRTDAFALWNEEKARLIAESSEHQQTAETSVRTSIINEF